MSDVQTIPNFLWGLVFIPGSDLNCYEARIASVGTLVTSRDISGTGFVVCDLPGDPNHTVLSAVGRARSIARRPRDSDSCRRSVAVTDFDGMVAGETERASASEAGADLPAGEVGDTAQAGHQKFPSNETRVSCRVRGGFNVAVSPPQSPHRWEDLYGALENAALREALI
jgi:hypothetical protein